MQRPLPFQFYAVLLLRAPFPKAPNASFAAPLSWISLSPSLTSSQSLLSPLLPLSSSLPLFISPCPSAPPLPLPPFPSLFTSLSRALSSIASVAPLALGLAICGCMIDARLSTAGISSPTCSSMRSTTASYWRCGEQAAVEREGRGRR
eukprot:6175041-Pleurochrysis_carterae.AAC.1